MTKKIIVGLVVAMTCALMACSGSEGPTESAPTSEAAQANDVSSTAIFYSCSGVKKPCSEEEFERITHLDSYSPLTGKFSQFGEACELINAAPARSNRTTSSASNPLGSRKARTLSGELRVFPFVQLADRWPSAGCEMDGRSAE